MVKTQHRTAAPVPVARPAEVGLVPDKPSDKTAYLVHIVAQGENAAGLAKKFGVTWSMLVAENAELRENGGRIYPGQVIYIPNVASPSLYTVKSGDTLNGIAHSHNVDLADLRAANRGHIAADDVILGGDRLVIPPPRPRPQLMTATDTHTGPQLMAPEPSGVSIRPQAAEPLTVFSPYMSPGAQSLMPGNTRPLSLTAVAPTAVTPPVPIVTPFAAPSSAITNTQLAAPSSVPETPAVPSVAMPEPAPVDAARLSARSFGSAVNPYTGRVLQRLLNRAGADIDVDGAPGSRTRDAITDFQQRNGLAGQNGVKPGQIDEATWAALVSAANSQRDLSGVQLQVTQRDLAEPQIAAAYNLLSALAHDDPARFRAMLMNDRARGADGLIVDRASLQAIVDRVQAHGFHLKTDPQWSYAEARSVADLVSNQLNVDRIYVNRTYDGMINRLAAEELTRYRASHPDFTLPTGFDLPAFTKALISTETSFDRNASSEAGARGLMQLMPGTAREVGVSDRSNAEQSIRGGIRYVLSYLDRYRGRSSAEFVPFLAAGYNYGPNGVVSSIPAVRETQEHGRIVDTLYGLYRATDEPGGVGVPTGDIPIPRPRPRNRGAV